MRRRARLVILLLTSLLVAGCSWILPLGTRADAAQPEDIAQSDSGIPGTWVSIPEGTFLMGTAPTALCYDMDELQHPVALTHRFECMTTEVTQAHFLSVMGYNPATDLSCGSSCPVETVSWHEASAYCNALSAQKGLAPCYACNGSGASTTCQSAPLYLDGQIYNCPGYRLPTEAEWEYAYRAGTTTSFYNGEITVCVGIDPLADQIAWYGSNSLKIAHPVARKAANAWGLHDMSGNVWEWCHDWRSSYTSLPVTDPWGTASGTERNTRGGYFGNNPKNLRAGNRSTAAPTERQGYLGFRCVRSLTL